MVSLVVKIQERSASQIGAASKYCMRKKHLQTFTQTSIIMRNHNCASSTTTFTASQFSPCKTYIFYTKGLREGTRLVLLCKEENLKELNQKLSTYEKESNNEIVYIF